ncbi:MAG: glycosyltransferase family 4 protein [Solirubrobacteraceae bacterium]
MNILFCTLAYYPDVTGGAERQARLQAEELVRRGHRVTVVCARAADAGSGELAGVRVVRLWRLDRRPFTRISYLLRLGAWLLHHVRGFDLIHVHLANLQADVAVLAARPWERPTYVKVACGGPVGEIVRLASVARLTRWYGVRHATRLQALSAEIAGELAEIGVRKERIVEIPNGIDVDEFTPVDDVQRAQLRTKLRLPRDTTVVLFVGRFVYYKGIDDLLRAWQEVNGNDVRLVIVGATKDDELDAPPGVIVRRWVKSALEYMQAADVFVQPSHADGMSNAVLEAMACGLPIVAFEHGATHDFIEHDRESVLVPARDTAALAAALNRLSNDALLRGRMGVAARQSARRYEVGRIVDLIEAEYRSMVLS